MRYVQYTVIPNYFSRVGGYVFGCVSDCESASVHIRVPQKQLKMNIFSEPCIYSDACRLVDHWLWRLLPLLPEWKNNQDFAWSDDLHFSKHPIAYALYCWNSCKVFEFDRDEEKCACVQERVAFRCMALNIEFDVCTTAIVCAVVYTSICESCDNIYVWLQIFKPFWWNSEFVCTICRSVLQHLTCTFLSSALSLSLFLFFSLFPSLSLWLTHIHQSLLPFVSPSTHHFS